ncbi:hypothetical protein ACFSTC_52735 [Nonomuraea ferruginea]
MDAELSGQLVVPDGARGVVLFAHGSGSSGRSPRNRYVAAALNEAGLGTLLFDLLTPEEEYDRANVFDIELLAGRLLTATERVREQLGRGEPAARLLRREHRRRRRPQRRGRAGRRRGRDRLTGRPPGSRGPASRFRTGADAAHRGRPRRAGARTEPGGPAGAGRREPPGDRARRHPPVRGARSPGPGRRPDRLLVRHPLHVTRVSSAGRRGAPTAASRRTPRRPARPGRSPRT